MVNRGSSRGLSAGKIHLLQNSTVFSAMNTVVDIPIPVLNPVDWQADA